MIVVTGGAGFIGSALVWGLNRRGITDILIVDALDSSEKWRNLVNLRFADYIDRVDFLAALKNGAFDRSLTGILHMGACSDTTERDTGFLMRNNYEYTKSLVSWCIEKDRRLVYASSAATYGDGGNGFSDAHDLLPRLRPLNAYGQSKHMVDLWAERNGYFDRIAGLKYFNVFGPNEYHKGEMRSLAHKAFEQIKATGRLQLFKSHRPDFSDGGQKRDFIYVKDVVDATLAVYNDPALNGIMNVGTGMARSFQDLAVAIFKAMGTTANIEYIDMPENLQRQYQYFTEADVDKLRRTTKVKPTMQLEEAVADYVKSYLKSDDPYLGNRKEG